MKTNNYPLKHTNMTERGQVGKREREKKRDERGCEVWLVAVPHPATHETNNYHYDHHAQRKRPHELPLI